MEWLDKLNAKFKKREVPEVEKYRLKDKEINKLSESFISQDEKYIASLGNGYIMNFLANKSAKKGFAFITDKRVYFKGSCLSGTGKTLTKTNEERTVDVKDITGSGFTYHRYWGILIALFLTIIVSIYGAIVGVYSSHDHYGVELKVLHYEWVDLEKLLYVWDELEWDEPGWIGVYGIRGLIDNEEYCSIYGDGDKITIVSYSNPYRKEEIPEAKGLVPTIDRVDELKEMIQDELNKRRKSAMPAINRIKIIRALIDTLCVGLGIPLVIVCCIGFKNYLLKRKTLFRIEYAGGCIAFIVSFYAKAEIDDFQKQLRRAKDMAEESTAISDSALEIGEDVSTQTKTVDDLRKYNELLKDGLITQEEYDAVKKNILGI